ncbi:MAG: transposase family protein [Defluviitaleaceae bacterium]|nr:transposase family protein [Defluviitaleaceae bacterium]
MVICGLTRKILCVTQAKGSVHDFKIFKNSKLEIAENILIVGDKGYLGAEKLYKNVSLTFKKPKGEKLTEEQKKFNMWHSRYRITIEHTYRKIKCFRIFSNRYRNKQSKHYLRFSLICAILNYELDF